MQGMLEIYQILPLGALFIIFARFAMQEANIFDWIPDLIIRIKNNDLRAFLFKPIVECPICMASVWGSLFYAAALTWLEYASLPQWCIFCCTLSGLMWVIINILASYEIEFNDIDDGTWY